MTYEELVRDTVERYNFLTVSMGDILTIRELSIVRNPALDEGDGIEFSVYISSSNVVVYKQARDYAKLEDINREEVFKAIHYDMILMGVINAYRGAVARQQERERFTPYTAQRYPFTPDQAFEK